MRINSALVFAALFVAGGSIVSGQTPTAKSTTLEARRANEHYKSGWEAMRKEAWDEAAREFQAAIDSDAGFELAYYALGRAEMGRKSFTRAIAAYTTCRDLYLKTSGERFTNQLDYRKRLEDRILQLQTALSATQSVSPGKGAQQSQQLYVRQLQTEITDLQQAKQRNDNMTLDAKVPYYVPMALGAAYFRNNQFAEAEKAYNEAIQANPDSGETHNNLAVLYLMTNRIDLAEKAVARAEKTGFKVNPGLKDDIHKQQVKR